MGIKELFTDIYLRNGWGASDTRSGPGSTLAETTALRGQLLRLLTTLNCTSLLDAPCGEVGWVAPIAKDIARYVGVDIVETLVASNRERFPQFTFSCANIITDPLPDADAILCRDCLVHFPLELIWDTLRNFASTRATYLLTTSFAARWDNDDIDIGDWRPINLTTAPFNLPPPVAHIDEQCTLANAKYEDKLLAAWPIAILRIALDARKQ